MADSLTFGGATPVRTLPDKVRPIPAGLSGRDIHRRLRHSLATMARSHGAVVLLFAEILHGRHFRTLGYGTIYQYAEQALGLSHTRTHNFLDIARRLDHLPRVRHALEKGEIGWTKALLVTQAATPESEDAWLDLAARCGRRELRRLVKEACARSRIQMKRLLVQAGGLDAASPAERSAGEGEGRSEGAGEGEGGGPTGGDGAGRAEEEDGGLAGERLAGRSSVPPTAPPAASGDDQGLRTPAEVGDSDRDNVTGRGAPELPLGPEAAAKTVPSELPLTPLNVTLRLDPEQWDRMGRLIEIIRKRRLVPAAWSREMVVLAGLEALSESVPPPGTPSTAPEGEDREDRIDPQTTSTSPSGAESFSQRNAAPTVQVVVHRCPDCGRGWVPGPFGEQRFLSQAAMDRLACDCREVDEQDRERSLVPPSVRRALLKRDGGRCQAPGCGSVRFLEAHHLVPISCGGETRLENLVTLCRPCHDALHERARKHMAARPKKDP